jgi:hypothetical protein
MVIGATLSDMALYVSIDGDDGNDGSLDHPLKTVSKASELARELREHSPVDVYLGAGTHRLRESLVVVGGGRSGHARPLVFAAMAGTTPTLSGAVRLKTCWSNHSEKVFVCDISGQVEGGFTQLFVDGSRQTLARFPSGNPLSPLLRNFSFIEGADERVYPDGKDITARPPLPHRELYLSDEFFSRSRWKRPEEAVIHIFPKENWNALQFRIKAIDYDRRVILLGEGGFQQHERWAARPGTMLDRTSRFYIENVFEELDSPGEWYFDRDEQRLYFYPPEDCDLDEAVFEVPVLKELVVLRGTRSEPLTGVSFRGIRFAGTVTTFLDPREVTSFGDWSIVRSGALLLENTENCGVENCFFDAVGGSALFASRYNRRLTVTDCLITECGESAIMLVGRPMLTREKSYSCPYCGASHPWGFGKHTDDFPGECLIENNRIHDVGVYGKQTAGLFMSVAARNTIRHNEMYNIPRAAVCIHDGTFGGHVIEYNYLHHSCRETDEHGTFNSWGRDSWWCHAQSHQGVSHPAGDVLHDAKYQTIIRNNRFRDFTGWCIDLDDGSSNYDIYNNVCIGAGIKNREGDYRMVHNNIVYLPTIAKPSAMQIGCEGNNDAWYNNLIYAIADPIHVTKPPQSGSIVKYCDYNCYYSRAGKFSSRGKSFKQWRELGLDAHSVFADPLFVDSEGGVFTVADDSPSKELGFENFPQDEYGTQGFPNTWVGMEPHHPIYDYDTMNRDMLKNMRDKATIVDPGEDGNYVLDPEHGRTDTPDRYSWRLSYQNGGIYRVGLEYVSPVKATCRVSCFVESIGASEITVELAAATPVPLRVVSRGISLSGEDTDIIELTIVLEGSSNEVRLDLVELSRD